MLNQIKTVLLLGLLSGLMLAIGVLLGGSQGLIIGLVFALIINVGSYFFSSKLVLLMYRAKEADPGQYQDLHQIVEEVSRRAGIPKPKVYIIPTTTPNAFATGRSPSKAVVACTEGIMHLLSKDELKGVIAHEIAHIKNRDMLITTIAVVIASVISYVAHMAQFAAIFGGRDDDGRNPLSLLVLAILTPIIATIIQLAISRTREFLADETGARIIKDSHSLANALRKLELGVRKHPLHGGNTTTSSLFIVNPFTAKGFITLFSTHPSTEDRIARLMKIRF